MTQSSEPTLVLAPPVITPCKHTSYFPPILDSPFSDLVGITSVGKFILLGPHEILKRDVMQLIIEGASVGAIQFVASQIHAPWCLSDMEGIKTFYGTIIYHSTYFEKH